MMRNRKERQSFEFGFETSTFPRQFKEKTASFFFFFLAVRCRLA